MIWQFFFVTRQRLNDLTSQKPALIFIIFLRTPAERKMHPPAAGIGYYAKNNLVLGDTNPGTVNKTNYTVQPNRRTEMNSIELYRSGNSIFPIVKHISKHVFSPISAPNTHCASPTHITPLAPIRSPFRSPPQDHSTSTMHAPHMQQVQPPQQFQPTYSP